MAEPLLQCSYMPGDSFAIAAWLALDKDARLVYLKDTTLADDKSAFSLGLYKDTKVDAKVTVIDLPPLWQATLRSSPCKEIYRVFSRDSGPPANKQQIAAFVSEGSDDKKTAVIKEVLTKLLAVTGTMPRKVTSVTGWLANLVSESKDQKLTELLVAWGVSAMTSTWAKDFDSFLSARAMATLKSNSLVIWSRQSGKRGGAHLELDSSYAGIHQLVSEFKLRSKGAHSLILAGDERESNKTGKAKLQAIATEHSVSYLGEFWKDEDWKKSFAENRLAQLAFWVYVHAKKSKLVHLGMRSGNLELMTLLKMTAVYLEPVGSSSGERMTAFQRKGIPYNRVQIAHSPGLTAQWGEDLEKGNYGKKMPAVQSTWEHEQKSKAQALASADLKAIKRDLQDVEADMKEAWNDYDDARYERLKTEKQQLLADKSSVYKKDYQPEAKQQLKTVAPKSKDQRARGFDRADVEQIIKSALSKMV